MVIHRKERAGSRQTDWADETKEASKLGQRCTRAESGGLFRSGTYCRLWVAHISMQTVCNASSTAFGCQGWQGTM